MRIAVTNGIIPNALSPLTDICAKVGAIERLLNENEILVSVTPRGIPIIVVSRMEYRIAPLTLNTSRIPVIARPISASSGAPEVICPRSRRLLLAVTIPALSRPIRAINSPIPTLIALFNGAGIALIILSRNGDSVIIRKITPLINTIARAFCHEYPIPHQIV